VRAMRQGGIFGETRTWVSRYVGDSGLGTNPTNPWCQHPRRPPSRSLSVAQVNARMKMGRPAQILGVAVGFGGLVAGLFLLDGKPLCGVLGMLGAMALILQSLARPRRGSGTE
jgi:hypothetical protein